MLWGPATKGPQQKQRGKGNSIALKQVNSGDPRSSPYSQWELARYCDMKAIQGSLIPVLYFLSRNKNTGLRMFGLQMGESAENDTETAAAANEVNRKIKQTGWKQRPGSWRSDNVVWIINEDGSKRLV